MSQPGTEAEPDCRKSWYNSFWNTFNGSTLITGIAVATLGISAAFATPEADTQSTLPMAPTLPPAEKSQPSPADSAVLWETERIGKAVLLGSGVVCPEGGYGLDGELVEEVNMGTTEIDPTVLAVRATRLYLLTDKNGDFTVFCGQDSGYGGTTGFEGYAVYTGSAVVGAQ